MARVAHPGKQSKATPRFLSDDEVFRLMQAFTRGMAGVGEITEDELRAVVDFATEARVKNMLVDMAIKGKVDLSVRDGEVRFQSASGRCVAMN